MLSMYSDHFKEISHWSQTHLVSKLRNFVCGTHNGYVKPLNTHRPAVRVIPTGHWHEQNSFGSDSCESNSVHGERFSSFHSQVHLAANYFPNNTFHSIYCCATIFSKNKTRLHHRVLGTQLNTCLHFISIDWWLSVSVEREALLLTSFERTPSVRSWWRSLSLSLSEKRRHSSQTRVGTGAFSVL